GGWLASANYAGYLLGALSAMRLAATPARALRTGLVAVCAATLLMGFTESFMGWLVLRALAGVASAWVLIFGSAWCLERLSQIGLPLLGGTVFAGVGFGIALTGLVCLGLMQIEVRSAQAWVVLGLLAFVLTAAVWRIFSWEPHSIVAPSSRVPPLQWRSNGVRIVLCYGAFGFGYIIPATFLPVMAKQIVHDPAVFGWSWPIFGLAAFLSTIGVTRLQRSLSNLTLWIAAQLIMAVGVALPVLWSGLVPIMLHALLVGGPFVVITMVGIQHARMTAGTQGPRLIAAMTAAFAVGQIAGPISVSWLARAGNGLAIALLIACSLLAISAGALYKEQRASALADAI